MIELWEALPDWCRGVACVLGATVAALIVVLPLMWMALHDMDHAAGLCSCRKDRK
jgi:fumarate reductase subunit D